MRRRVLVVMLVGLFVSLAGVGLWAALTWNTGIVDPDTVNPYYMSVAVDPSGAPRIAYYRSLGLTLASWNGTNWDIETVDEDGGSYPSLVTDGSGRPRIAYFLDGYLTYASWNGASWDIGTVDPVNRAQQWCSLALQADGRPCIAYYDYMGVAPDFHYDLRYAEWSGGAWHLETVDSVGDVGKSCSLALDSTGHPHIAYRDTTNGDLKYAAWNGAAWNAETVDSGAVTGQGMCVSLALDADDHPHISYRISAWQLWYATHDGTTWTRQLVEGDSGGLEPGNANSIAVDSSGNPHISYVEHEYFDLKYASWNGTSWETEIADGGWVVDYQTSLCLDAADEPHIAYCPSITGTSSGDKRLAYGAGSFPYAVRWPR